MLLSELAKLKESEDKVEFKAATKNFSYAGSGQRIRRSVGNVF